MIQFTKFLRDDTGAVTIDWVALTAGILLLGIIVVYAIFNNGVSSLVSNVNSTLFGVNIVVCKSNASATGTDASTGTACSVQPK